MTNLFDDQIEVKPLSKFQLENIKRYFEALFKFEKNYEKLKRELIKVKGFIPEKIYSAIDYMDMGYVSKNLFKGFMKKQSLGVTDEEAEAFYARFGIFGEELKFNFKHFEKIVKPFDFSI